MSSENYSRKDSNRNRKIDEKESKKFLILTIVAVTICVFLTVLYYTKTHPSPTTTDVINEAQPKSVPTTNTTPSGPDEAHPYDLSKPPHKQ